MKLEILQTVRLKTGEEAVILEVYNDGEAYQAEIFVTEADYTVDPPKSPKIRLDTITPSDIQSIFESVEKPFTAAI